MQKLIRAVNQIGAALDVFWTAFGIGWSIICRVGCLVILLVIVLGLTLLTLVLPPLSLVILLLGGSWFIYSLRDLLRDIFEVSDDESIPPMHQSRLGDDHQDHFSF